MNKHKQLLKALSKDYKNVYLEEYPLLDRLSTKILSLDRVLGGGLPCGRIIEIYGPESVGKTTLATHLISSALSVGWCGAYVDAEFALDMNQAKKRVNLPEDIIYKVPHGGEEALDFTVSFLKECQDLDAKGIVVVDSIPGLVPKNLLEEDIQDSKPMSPVARLLSSFWAKLAEAAFNSNGIIIFINQLRDQVGVMYGNPTHAPGGKAIRYATSVILEMRKTSQSDPKAKELGNRVNILVTKNKTSKPNGSCQVNINFESGFDLLEPLFDEMEMLGLVTKAGSWFTFDKTVLLSLGYNCEKDILKFQGKEQCLNFIKEQNLFELLYNYCKSNAGLQANVQQQQEML